MTFISNAAITLDVEKNSINYLVKALKANTLWTKLSTIYPFVGGLASSCKWNLKDPRDLDVAYRITWYGGMSFGSYGVQGNGTNAYGDSFFKPSNFNTNSGSLGVYIGNNIDEVSGAVGALNSVSYTGWGIYPRISNTFYSQAGKQFLTTANSDATGIYIVSGYDALTSFTYKNGSILIVTNAGTLTTNTNNFYISARNLSGSIDVYSTHKIGFLFMGNGLTQTETIRMNNIINTFKTILSR